MEHGESIAKFLAALLLGSVFVWAWQLSGLFGAALFMLLAGPFILLFAAPLILIAAVIIALLYDLIHWLCSRGGIAGNQGKN